MLPSESQLTVRGRALVDSGRKFEQQNGHPPTARDFKSPWPSYRTCIREFGSWDNYISVCGWEPRGRGRPRKC
jgi:hypothetical protein